MLSVDQLPYLTGDLPPIGGRLKARPQDFMVEEVPLYEPSGSGTHVYFRIEKVGLPTMHAIGEIARALDRRPFEIGYAGLKDADAVATQMLSLEHIDPALIQRLQVPGVRVVSVNRHTNKIKLGHHKGNRFRIRIREVNTGRLADARAGIEVLARRGVPNYFGWQRFGVRGDTGDIGRALLKNDFDEAIAVMLGRPSSVDRGDVLLARQHFDAGRYEQAASAWPYMFRNERRACREMAVTRGKARKAMRVVDRQARRFYISAYQSALFNQVAAWRIGQLDQLMPGDLAWRHPQGAVFRVEDPDVEQPRCAAFEISPTGPIYGHRMTAAEGEPGRVEQEVLAAEGLKLDDFCEGPQRMPGGRRPVRFQPHDAAIEAGRDDLGDYFEVGFFLESGCYATMVLRELMKAAAVGSEPPEDET